VRVRQRNGAELHPSWTDREILVVHDATALTGSITGGSFGYGEEVYTLDAPLHDGTAASG
jgi:iron complex outermembrane receptor protein